jgi:rhodanese-related sulfurtransferase
MTTAHRQFKSAIYGHLARVSKALAAPQRLELLDLLCQSPRTVEALAGQAGLSVANASQHLRVLRSARLVEAEKRGLYVEYRLADTAVGEFYASLRALAERQLAEVRHITREYLSGRDALESVDQAELLRRVQAGAVTLLDVRPAEEYRSGHIAGAVSIPLPELKRRLRELPKRRQIVAYCRGPYCVMAMEAVDILRSRGFRAERLEHGAMDWRAHGLEVATGAGEER